MTTNNRWMLPVVLLCTLAACGHSLESLHGLAKVGQVEAGAPLMASQSVDIAASPSAVWQTLSAIEGWSQWLPHVTATTAPSSLAVDAPFTWEKNGSTIHSTLAIVEPQKTLAWSGQVATAKAIHVWRLSEPTPGVTHLEVTESMSGFMLTAFFSQAQLEADMAESLAALKTTAERIASK